MTNIKYFIAYLCVLTITIVIALPAYIVGESGILTIATITAFIATTVYMTYISYTEYED